MDKFPQIGDGDNAGEFEKRVLSGKRYNPAEVDIIWQTYTFGQKVNDLAKLILRSERKGFCKICNQLFTNCLFGIW